LLDGPWVPRAPASVRFKFGIGRIYGLARAAQVAGQATDATNAYAELLALGRESDGTRAEIVAAKAYATKR
jgi:hypothetical protein